jgi:hypothetical protein
MSMNTLENYTLKMSAKGWQVINRTETAVQLKRGRRWNRLLLISGLVLLPFGAGLIILILALIDYLVKSEKIITVYESDLLAGREPDPSTLSTPLLIGGLLVGAVLAVVMFVIVLGWFFISLYLACQPIVLHVLI